MSTRRQPRRDAEYRYLAEQQLQRSEGRIETVVRQAMSDWLDEARKALLYAIALNQPGLTAAGYQQFTTSSSDAILATYGGWRKSLDSKVLPEIEVAFGEAFNQARKSSEYSSYRWQQDYMHDVRDRLVIWPEDAFEDIRPELEEALSEGESFDEIKDRVGWVLNIDAKSRALRADIDQVDKALADPNTNPADIPELKQRRRDLWNAHDEELGEWEWKARRIARTEAHGAREGGTLAAAQAMELATGEKHYKRWLSTDDLRTRLTHRVADGQMVPLASPFLVGGFPLQWPGDPEGPGHETINCRCTLMIYDQTDVQNELQGPDGSVGEVRPGGMRLGPDDPDDARAAVEALAGERGESPSKDLRADPSVTQAMPPKREPTPPTVPDEAKRGAVIPDMGDKSNDELTDMMDQAYDAQNWELFDAIESELGRRNGDTVDHDDDRHAEELAAWVAAESQWHQEVTDWLGAETQWHQDVTDWLAAETKAQQDWAEAEKKWREDPLPGLKRAKTGADDVAMNIYKSNPKYDDGEEYQVNCQRCVQAYELRRRGYDVQAAPNHGQDKTPVVMFDDPSFGYLNRFGADRLAEMWKYGGGVEHIYDMWREPDGSVREFKKSSAGQLAKTLAKQPDKARGWVVLEWKDGTSGHVFVWEKLPNGTVTFNDPQPGKMGVEYLERAKRGTIRWMRTDDLMPTEAVRDKVVER